MDRGLELIQEPRARECVATGAQRAQGDAPIGQAPQLTEQRRGDRFADVDAAANEQNVHWAELVERHGRGELQAAARHRRLTVERRDAPLVDVTAENPVRHPQGLERIRDRD
jgi:hypothetical protein